MSEFLITAEQHLRQIIAEQKAEIERLTRKIAKLEKPKNGKMVVFERREAEK